MRLMIGRVFVRRFVRRFGRLSIATAQALEPATEFELDYIELCGPGSGAVVDEPTGTAQSSE